VATGNLDPDRLESYRKLGKEAAFNARRTDQHARWLEQKKWKRIHREYRKMQHR
jgi:ribosome biogenesis GTPase